MAEPTPSSASDTSSPWWVLPRDFWQSFSVLVLLVSLVMLWLVRSALTPLEATFPNAEFPEVELHFQAQQATLTGRVLDHDQSQAAAALAGEKLRSWGMNPVARVRNDIVVRPNPPGFVVLIRERDRAMLAGETFTNTEQDHLLADLTSVLPPKVDTLLLHTATERGPSGDLLRTISSLKSMLQQAPPREPLLLAVTLGSAAQKLEFGDTQALEEKFHREGWDWAHSQALVLQLGKWIAESAESDRRMALPLPHLTLLAAGNEVFLRGTVASDSLKETILTGAKLFYGADKLRADVQVSDGRRPVQQAGSTLTTFPEFPDPKTTGVLGFAVPGQSWKTRELPDDDFYVESLDCYELMPAEFPLELAQEDFVKLGAQQALHRAYLEEMALKATYPVPFAAMLLIGKQVHLHGEVPTREIQDAVLTAVRKAYADLELEDHLHLNEMRRPMTAEQAAHFTEGLPAAPLATSPGVMAFILPGRSWQSVNIPLVELRAEEFDEFVHFHLIPSSFPQDDAKDDFTAFRDIVTEHFRNTSSMKLSEVPPEPYLALLALGKKVILRGNAGSESLKQAVLEGARKFYSDREVEDEIRIDSNPPLVIKPGLTIKTFPPRPTLDGPGVLGFVRAGQPWLQVPLTVNHPEVTLEWLQTQGLFSKDFDARQAWRDYESWLPLLPVKPASPSPEKK